MNHVLVFIASIVNESNWRLILTMWCHSSIGHEWMKLLDFCRCYIFYGGVWVLNIALFNWNYELKLKRNHLYKTTYFLPAKAKVVSIFLTIILWLTAICLNVCQDTAQMYPPLFIRISLFSWKSAQTCFIQFILYSEAGKHIFVHTEVHI